MNGTRIMMMVAAILITAQLPQPACAATWTVEKDGSGDFTIIQDALDAAAAGDTIQIGPGRYDTFHVNHRLLDGFLEAAIAWVRTTDLTIIGAGSQETIIGPSASVLEFNGQRTASLLVDAVGFAEVRDIGLENARYELDAFTQVLIEECRIERTDGARSGDVSAYFGFSDGSVFRRCEMINTGGLTTISGVTNLLIEDCYFEDLQERNGSAVLLGGGAQDCVVRRCEVVGSGAAIQAGGRTLVEDCVMTGVRVVGLEALSGGHMIARRCHVGLTRLGARIGTGMMEIHDSVLEGGTQYTIASTAQMLVRNSHILNAGGQTVLGSAPASSGEIIDLRHNWWGTPDPAQIEAWIEDDEGTTLWQPFNDMPVSTESESISGLKGKFRRN